MARAKGEDTTPQGVEDVVAAFQALLLPDKQEAMKAMQEALQADVATRKAQLMAELEALGGALAKPTRTPRAPNADGDGRVAVKPLYRGPAGQEWSGRGGIPKWAKAMGIVDKAGLEPYRIVEGG